MRGKVHINEHKVYDYSTAIIQSGFIDGLSDYVKNNDGIFFEQKRMLHISRKHDMCHADIVF